MKYTQLALASALACAVLGCDIERSRPAVGRVTSIIAVAADSLWTQVGGSVEQALEPRVFTVRDEKTFELTQVNPGSSDFRELRRFRHVLVIGSPEDFWVREVLDRHDAPPAELPAIIEQRDVWARSQLVTAMVLPPDGGAQDVLELLDALAQQIDARFHEYARSRMFLSGADTALQNSLHRTADFSLLLPGAYRHQRTDSAWVFRHHSEVQGVLQRGVLVTWRSGVPGQLDAQEALAWRESVADMVYDPRQDIEHERFETRTVDTAAGPALEVQGVWQSEDISWPAAGPFITRVVTCPDQNRTYLLDGWVYAPGPNRSKYEYLIQMHTILDSFRCGDQPPAPRPSAAA